MTVATVAATVSYLHMDALVELHGQPGMDVGRRDDRGRLNDRAGGQPEAK